MARATVATLFVLTASALACAGAVGAQNRQAVSTSLAECSAIFDEIGSLSERRGKPEGEVNEIFVSAALFMVEAREQAGREGHPNPHTHIRSELARLMDKWDGRLSRIALLRENKDWIDYCRALGKKRGIALP